MRDFPNLIESTDLDLLTATKDELIQALPDMRARLPDIEKVVDAAQARVDRIAKTMPQRLVKERDPHTNVLTNVFDQPAEIRQWLQGATVSTCFGLTWNKVPLAKLRAMNRRRIVDARGTVNYSKRRDAARQSRRWWVDTMRAQQQVLRESGYTDAVAKREAARDERNHVRSCIEIAESYTKEEDSYAPVSLPGDEELETLINRYLEYVRRSANCCGGQFDALLKSERDVEMCVMATRARTPAGVRWKLKELIQFMDDEDSGDGISPIDQRAIRSVAADLDELATIERRAGTAG